MNVMIMFQDELYKKRLDRRFYIVSNFNQIIIKFIKYFYIIINLNIR